MKETDEIVTVGTAFLKLRSVEPLDDFRIRIEWHDGQRAHVDLGPTIFTFKIYASLRESRALFETVHVVNDSVIAWGEDDEIDMHVSEIERLAGEVMDGSSFQTFLETMGLTWDAAAAQLGMSRRMIGYYAKGRDVPRYVALACAYLREHRSTTSGRSPLPD